MSQLVHSDRNSGRKIGAARVHPAILRSQSLQSSSSQKNEHSALVWVYADVVCDLFHPGHVEFFRQARKLGTDWLSGEAKHLNPASLHPIQPEYEAGLYAYATVLELRAQSTCLGSDRDIARPMEYRRRQASAVFRSMATQQNFPRAPHSQGCVVHGTFLRRARRPGDVNSIRVAVKQWTCEPKIDADDARPMRRNVSALARNL
jgi:hypothetical protein